jgi:UDP-N-acetylmuramyl pentapeptide synthase
MGAAIDTLAEMAGEHPSHLVVGDMLELGPEAAALHMEMGARAAQAGIGFLYAAGEHADAVARGAVDGGMCADHIVAGDKDRLLAALLERLARGGWVLVKGSRGMRMEHVVAGLISALSDKTHPNGGKG